MTDSPDMRIEWDESESGIKEMRITALNEQGEIDLAMERARILKLLSREWENSGECD